MKAIILAAGQGTRLRPLTDQQPKCMVKVAGISIIKRQLNTMRICGIRDEDIAIVCGYRADILKEHLADTNVNLIVNNDFMTTNMVCSLMCAQSILSTDVIVSYGDIIYSGQVLQTLLRSAADISIVVDDGWLPYWQERCDDPTQDAETLKFGMDGTITEIGQKTSDISDIESQYIGLMKFTKSGAQQVVSLAQEAKKRTDNRQALWRTSRNYQNMYMTDLLQGLADERIPLTPVHIQRGWFEIDNPDDLAVAEKHLKQHN